MIDFLHRISAVAFPINYYVHSARLTAFANHSCRQTISAFYVSTDRRLDAALQPLRMHRTISFPVVSSVRSIGRDHAHVGFAIVAS